MMMVRSKGEPTVPLDHDALAIELGTRLRALRYSRDLPRRALAERLGVTHQQVQKYEQKGQMSVTRFIQYCLALNIPAEYVLKALITSAKPREPT